MPYKYRGAWHEQSRAYLNTLRPPGVQSERGVVREKTVYYYGRFLFEAGELLGFPNPLGVTLEQMKELERAVGNADRTIACKCSVIRSFLRWVGNPDAGKWKISAHPRPYRGGVFLSERQVAKLHQESARLGPLEELVIALAVDMGLRCVDIKNLTLENASNFLQFGEDEILGKGRDGGKVALQTFSEYVRGPLQRYLKHRAELVERTGDRENRKLVVIPVIRRRGNYLTSPSANRYNRLMAKLSSKLGTKFTMHDLRRTLGNRLWRRGVPIETIAKLLRHEDCGVTFKAYIGVDACNMRDALNALNETRPQTSSQTTTVY